MSSGYIRKRNADLGNLLTCALCNHKWFIELDVNIERSVSQHRWRCSNKPVVDIAPKKLRPSIEIVNSGNGNHPLYLPVGSSLSKVLESAGITITSSELEVEDFIGLDTSHDYSLIELDERANHIVSGNREVFGPSVPTKTVVVEHRAILSVPMISTNDDYDEIIDDNTIFQQLKVIYPQALTKIWEFQSNLDFTFSEVGIGKKFALRNGASWQKLVSVYNFGLEANLSEFSGDKLLDLFAESWSGQAVATNLPEGWKSMKRAIDRVVEPASQIKFAEIQWPVELFGTVDEEGVPLRPIRIQYLDITERIAQHLWDIEPDLLMLTSREPTASVSVNTSATTFEIRENIRVYDGYDSGRIFTSHSKSVKEVHGVTTVVLDISLSTDKSQKNQTGSRVGKPLTMLISNCTGAAYQPILLGHLPSAESSPYTEAQQHEFLIGQGCLFPSQRNDIISYWKRKVDLIFWKMVMEQMDGLQEKGFLARVGNRRSGDLINNDNWHHFAACFSIIIGDNEELDGLMGTNTKGIHNCRSCIEKDTWKFVTSASPIQWRSHADSERLTTGIHLIQMKKWTQSMLTGTSYTRSPTELALVREMENHSLRSGDNPLFKFGRFNSRRDGPSGGLPGMLPADWLHTWNRGAVEYAVGWSLHLIQHVSDVDKVGFEQSRSLLDKRFKTFSRHQTAYAVKLHNQHEGIWDTIKKESIEYDKPTTGYVLGTIAAWEIPSILMQTMFCIGSLGDVLPTTPNWCAERGLSAEFQWNLTSVVIEAMAAVLEASFYGHCDIMSDVSISTYGLIVDNARYKLSILRHVLSNVLLIPKPGSDGSRKLAVVGGVINGLSVAHTLMKGTKLHHAGKFAWWKKQIGSDFNKLDTQCTENSHIRFNKEAFNRSSKQFEVQNEQMLSHVLRVEGVSRMKALIRSINFPSIKRSVPVSSIEQLKLFFQNPKQASSVAKFQEFKCNLNGAGEKVVELLVSSGAQPYLHPIISVEDIIHIMRPGQQKTGVVVSLTNYVNVVAKKNSVVVKSWQLRVDPQYIMNRSAHEIVKVKESLFGDFYAKTTDEDINLFHLLAIAYIRLPTSELESSHPTSFEIVMIAARLLKIEVGDQRFVQNVLPYPHVCLELDTEGHVVYEVITQSQFVEGAVVIKSLPTKKGNFRRVEDITSTWFHVPSYRIVPPLGAEYSIDYVERFSSFSSVEDLIRYQSLIVNTVVERNERAAVLLATAAAEKKRKVQAARISNCSRGSNVVQYERSVGGITSSLTVEISEILSHTGDHLRNIYSVLFVVCLLPVEDNLQLALPWSTVRNCSVLTDYESQSGLIFKE